MITTIILIVTVLVSIKCFSDEELFNKLALKPYRVVHNNEWYRIITHGFVHANSMHLIFNMITFYSFGDYIERAFGQIFSSYLPYILLYFGGLIAASVYDVIKHKNNEWYTSIGASGAVSAIMFTFILLAPWAKLQLFFFFPIPGIVMGVIFLVFCQYMSKNSNDHINHNAHFYGAIYGFLFPIILKPELFTYFVHQLLKF